MAMRRLYGWLIYLAVPPAFAAVLWRGLRDRGYWQGLGERFGFGPRPAGRRGIWLHAVSLGEVAAAAPIVHALRARHPETPLVLSTATPTGRARARELFGGGVDVCFLPYDMPGAVARFLERIGPRLALIMETELWPNLFHECARRDVPLVLANARISARSASRYRRFGALFRELFTARVLIAAQSGEDAERFASIGAAAANIRVVGNVKFDLDVGPAVLEHGRLLRGAICGERPAWIAGSTHAGEEEQVLDAHARLCAVVPGALLILAPRHPNRFAGVADLLVHHGVRFVRRTSGAAVPADCGVLLLDTVGELLVFYACADVAFVGGSLVAAGGHNLLEPAALGVPVLTGPSDFNGREIADLLLRTGAALRVTSATALAARLGQWFADPDSRRRAGALGRRAVELNRGSVARLLELIEPLFAGSVGG